MYITLKFRQAKDVYNNNSLITGGGLTASFFVNKNFKLAKTVKSCYKIHVFAHKTCKFRKSPYLCNVFFIVLDFKVNKGWSTAVLLFLCLYISYLYIQNAVRTSQKISGRHFVYNNKKIRLNIQPDFLSLLSDSNQRPRDYKSRALAN